MPEKPPFRILGTRTRKVDDPGKVTGRALFGADIYLPDMLQGAVLRSPHAHARILSIHTEQAELLPGVKAIITARDLPAIKDGEATKELIYQRDNLLAGEKALYYGHALVAVAAVDRESAQLALEKIRVEYELLPPVLDVQVAMRKDAPILHPDLHTLADGKDKKTLSNIASQNEFTRGNLELGFQEAEVIVERQFSTATVHQGYLEPPNAMAHYSADGKITIWCSTQGAFGVRDQLSEILQIPATNIRVIPTEIGGGFGGKNRVYLEPLAAMLSQKCGYTPVQMSMRWEEILASTGPASGSVIHIRMGANKMGCITAVEAWLAYEAGAYPGSPVDGAAVVMFAPYRIDNIHVITYDVLVNKPHTSSYRAPGSTNAAFAVESVVDELSEKLGIDPVEFRAINAAKQGDARIDGSIHPCIGFQETLMTAKEHAHYRSPIKGPWRGRGVASGFWFNGGGMSSARAQVNTDGTIQLIVGSIDLSGTRTTLAMQLAETMCVPFEAIQPEVGDTDAVGYTEGTYGSRTTFSTGIAVCELGRKLITTLCERAARMWSIKPEEVAYSDGIFSAQEQKMSFQELASKLLKTGGLVNASVSVYAENEGPAFATHLADVEVDQETGQVRILRYTAIQDVGRAIHPGMVEGQIQGGTTQGIGWALSEGYIYDENGYLLNSSLQNYLIPTCQDMPDVETVWVEIPNPAHPYGVRGVGEIPIVPPPAAIANAIYRATGVRMECLPMSPERILERLNKARSSD